MEGFSPSPRWGTKPIDAITLPPNDRDPLGVPSWRWVVMWAALVGIVLAGMFGLLPRPTKENSLLWVAAVVVGVAAAVYLLSRTHALLPRKHKTICKIAGAKNPAMPDHFLSYITKYEQKLLHYLSTTQGRATASKGPMGSQGVPCFPNESLRRAPGFLQLGQPASPRTVTAAEARGAALRSRQLYRQMTQMTDEEREEKIQRAVQILSGHGAVWFAHGEHEELRAQIERTVRRAVLLKGDGFLNLTLSKWASRSVSSPPL